MSLLAPIRFMMLTRDFTIGIVERQDEMESWMGNDEREIDSAIAGQLLSSWLPIGILRKIIFSLFLIVCVINVTYGDIFLALIFLFLMFLMSPRVVGEVSYLIGKLKGSLKN